MNLGEIYTIGKKVINKNDLLILIEDILNFSTIDVFLNEKVEVKNYKDFFRKIERVKNGEPVQYVVGKTKFLDLDIFVDYGVFIPRKETEELVFNLKNLFNKDFSGNIIDLCAGSGVIALSLKRWFENSNVYSIEKSEQSFEYLCKNSETNGLKINPILGDISEKTCDFENNFFDLIVSNPPYVRKNDIKNLDLNVRYEPIMALDGGIDGLDFYRKIIEMWTTKLKENGLMAFEVGKGQFDYIYKLMKSSYFRSVKIIKDFSGIERIILGKK